MFFDRTKRANFDALDQTQAVIEFTPDGTILGANAKFLSVFGYALSDIEGQHHSLFVEASEREAEPYRIFWEALRRGEFQQAEYRRFSKSGKEIWIQAAYNPVRDRAGRLIRIVKVGTDITQQKLRSVADAAKVAAIQRSQSVIEFALDGTILDANANFLATVGYSLEEVRGRHHSIFVSPEEKDSDAYRDFWAALARGEYRSSEYKRFGKGDREIWLQATYNPVLDPAGRPIGVVKFAVDITADKLRTLDFTGQIAAINKSQGVVQFALDGTILGANENFLAAMGYRLEEVLGKHHRIFVESSQADAPDYLRFWQHLRSGQFHAANYKRRGKSGREVWIQATYNPVLDTAGLPSKVVKYCVDITATMTTRQQALAASAHTQSNVQASAAAAEQLSASVEEIARSAARSKSLMDEVSLQARAGDRSTTELEQASSSMNRIVQVIQSVGEQISLLSLNATIEAARAGEAGRGFAVVAGEVKALAGQVTHATQQITQDIHAMQTVAGTVVGSLRAIERSVMEVHGMMSSIASAVEEQSAVTREISTSINGASSSLAEVNGSLAALAV